MSLRDWLLAMLHADPPAPDPAKQGLDRRQMDVAGRLARMKGIDRDEVLAEAYRRFDRRIAKP